MGLPAIEEIIEQYRPIIEQTIAQVFQELPINTDEIVNLCGNLVGRNVSMGNSSGLVIAGFGEKEVFPSLYAYDCEAIVGNRMRYVPTNKAKIGVVGSDITNAAIHPFAQREMVNRFMEGIDPVYQTQIQNYLATLLEKGYPGLILDALGSKFDDTEKLELNSKLATLGKSLGEDFSNQFSAFRQENYIGPILDTVASLPKDELAAMAESLVNLTSFKRRVTSAEQDTVGGPIDVAVISKGDGFIWIKRKHYFDKDLNPFFFANYYRKDEVEEEENA